MMAGNSRRPPPCIIDEIKQVPDKLFKAQLMDTSDIVSSLSLAPPTKKLMKFRQEQEADELFETPGRPHHSFELQSAFRRKVPGATGPGRGPPQYKQFKKPMIKSKFHTQTSSQGKSHHDSLPEKNVPIIVQHENSTELEQATQTLVAEAVQHHDTLTGGQGNVVVLVSEDAEGMFPSSVIEQLQSQPHAIAFQSEGDAPGVQTVYVNVAELDGTTAAMLQGQPLQIDLSNTTPSTSVSHVVQSIVTSSGGNNAQILVEGTAVPGNVVQMLPTNQEQARGEGMHTEPDPSRWNLEPSTLPKGPTGFPSIRKTFVGDKPALLAQDTPVPDDKDQSMSTSDQSMSTSDQSMSTSEEQGKVDPQASGEDLKKDTNQIPPKTDKSETLVKGKPQTPSE